MRNTVYSNNPPNEWLVLLADNAGLVVAEETTAEYKAQQVQWWW